MNLARTGLFAPDMPEAEGTDAHSVGDGPSIAKIVVVLMGNGREGAEFAVIRCPVLSPALGGIPFEYPCSF